MIEVIEAALADFASWLKLGVELLSIVVIALGIALAVYRVVIMRTALGPQVYRDLRLQLAHFLVIALELQLAADIVGTAVAPSWDRIGKLAAIAVIRTFLNYFLERELAGMRRE